MRIGRTRPDPVPTSGATARAPKSPAGSVHQWVSAQAGRRQLGRRRPSRRNLAEISVRISSPAANATSRSSAATCTTWSARDRSRISIHSCSASQTRDVLERVEVEVGAELAVEHGQHVAVELGGHALRRRRRRATSRAGVLDQVGAEQERVARGAGVAAHVGEERRPAARARGCRSCSRGTRPAAVRCRGSSPRWRSKSPTTGVDLEARVLRGDRRARPPRAPRGRRRRARTAAACRRSRSASSSSRVFSEVPEPSSTSVSAPVGRGDLVGPGARGSPARRGSGSTPAAG